MKRICPNPIPWNEAYKRLMDFARAHDCAPLMPPKPLILAGWVYSNDMENKNRWDETIKWAYSNNYQVLVENIPDNEFYSVEKPTSYTVGPLGGPMYRPWDYETKDRPSTERLEKSLETLVSQWPKIAGKGLARITRPVSFTGRKVRRLLVQVDSASNPPWGGWAHLSQDETERCTFTEFRASVNKAISPHEVDHIDFVADEIAEQGTPADAKNRHNRVLTLECFENNVFLTF